MKTEYLKLAALLSPVMTVLIACGDDKNENQNPDPDPTPSEESAGWQSIYSLVADDPDADPLQYSIGAQVVLSEAKVHAENLRLELPEGISCSDTELQDEQEGVICEDSDESSSYVAAGPFVIDLIQSTITPEQEGFSVPPGSYNRLDFDLVVAEVDSLDGDALESNSVYAAGTFTDSGATDHGFSIALPIENSFSFTQDEAVELAADETGQIQVRFDQSTWLDGLDLQACLDNADLAYDGDNNLVINSDTVGAGDCETIQSDIEANMINSASAEMAKVEDEE